MMGDTVTVDLCDKTIGKYRLRRLALGMIFMLSASVCFYSVENLKMFLLISLIGMVIISYDILCIKFRRIRISICVIWLILIY